MSASFKDFADLQSIRKTLKQQEQARQLADAERARSERQAKLEADLFRNSVGTVAPLPSQNRHLPNPPRPEPIARQHLADEQAALQESLSDDFDVESLLDTDQALSYARSGVGQDVVRKLRKGHWVIQDQIDLHGYRRDEARESLAEFLKKAGRRGLRCVRIIHGKGLGSVNKEPVLKNMVHRWLVQKDEVIAFCVARASDGGAGALVVLLKGSS
jgi:DNA-nicking Smr family endonuclease